MRPKHSMRARRCRGAASCAHACVRRPQLRHSGRCAGSVELQVAWRLMAMLEDTKLSSGASAEISGRVHDLLSGALRLPFAHMCALPAAIFCPNGCADVYCCSRCAAEAWQRGHCLLCAGAPRLPREAHLRGLPGCPYVRPFDAAALHKFGHDRGVFGWMLGPPGHGGGPQVAMVRACRHRPRRF